METVQGQRSRQNTCESHSLSLAELLKRVISEPVRKAVLEGELGCGSKICKWIRAGLTVPGQAEGPIPFPAVPSSNWRVHDQDKHLGLLPYNPPTPFKSYGLLETDALFNTMNKMYFHEFVKTLFESTSQLKIHCISWKGIAQVCFMKRHVSLFLLNPLLWGSFKYTFWSGRVNFLPSAL